MRKTTSILLLSTLLSGVYAEEQKGGESNLFDNLYFSMSGDVSYVGSSLTQDEKDHTYMPFFTEMHGGHDDHGGHSHVIHGENGFNLNYFEFEVLYQPYEGFNLFINLHNSGSGFEVEEMYVEKHDLLIDNLDVKAGKFYSNFGIVSSKHANTWDFANMPLIYSAQLGGERLLDEGIGLRFFPYHESPLSFGAEIYQGDGEFFGLAEIDIHDNSDNVRYIIEENLAPNVYTAFIQYKGELDELGIETGAAYIKGEANIDHDHGSVPHAFEGETEYYAAHLALTKHFSDYQSLKWQSEYIGRELSGTRWDATTEKDVEHQSDGFYTQLVYIDDKMEYGVRYDTIFNNEKTVGSMAFPDYDMDKLSAMVNYRFNDFSKLRLEVARDRSRYEGPKTNAEKVESTDVVLQYIFSFGKEPKGGHHH